MVVGQEVSPDHRSRWSLTLCRNCFCSHWIQLQSHHHPFIFQSRPGLALVYKDQSGRSREGPSLKSLERLPTSVNLAKTFLLYAKMQMWRCWHFPTKKRAPRAHILQSFPMSQTNLSLEKFLPQIKYQRCIPIWCSKYLLIQMTANVTCDVPAIYYHSVLSLTSGHSNITSLFFGQP